ncbi:unnamed protein product [Mucor hiemalis]
MEKSAEEHTELSTSTSTGDSGVSLQTCVNCKENQLSCNLATPCSSCISLGKTDHCSNTIQPISVEAAKIPAKRGYKSHVPSACINCRTAHLACDVSRPCQRCVTLKKTDTCQDIQHKKRGRPKLREKKIYSSDEHTYEILHGTIQSPSIAMNYSNNNRNIMPNNQVPPFKAKLANITKRPPNISFVHQPIESFQIEKKLTTYAPQIVPSNNHQVAISSIPTTTSIPLSFDYSSNNVLIETVLPTAQFTTNSESQQQQQFLFDYTHPILTETTPILLNNGIITPTNIENNLQVQNDNDLVSIIMSMEVCCAKVSDNIIQFWGYYPQELAHRSFYDFISPKDSDRLARLHRLLLDNAMGTTKTNHTPSLPSTERTTSSVFSNSDHSTLSVIANGSRSFSDSIHIKKRSGEYELYKIVVYIGGGLGADLHDVSSFSKQYIVAQFRKHEYEVSLPQTTQPLATTPTDEIPSNNSPFNFQQPFAVFSPVTPLSPTSPSKTSCISRLKMNGERVELFKDHSLFPKKKSSAASKFSQMSIIPPISPPKFNIAPVTSTHISTPQNKDVGNSLFRRFLSSSHSKASVSPLSSVRLRSTDNAVVTHPTQQYFLQTSSSTLNAAASAAQSKTRLSISGPTNNDNSSTTNRKIEMSIRSLLC